MKGKTIKKGQALSLELVIVVVIFFIALAIFGALVLKQDPGAKTVRTDAEKTIQFVSSDSPKAFVEGGKVNETKILEFNYTQLKKSIGVNSYVCIYFEDKNGQLVKINGSIVGIGDPNITINDEPCIPNS